MANASKKPKSKTGLSARDQKILTACLEQPTFERAAKAAGVSTTTLWRRRQRPEFRKALQEVGREGLAQGMARLQQNSTLAANVLLRIMSDITNPPGARLRAVESILAQASAAVERDDLAARIAALEEAGRQRGPQLVVDAEEKRSDHAQQQPELSRREQKLLMALLEQPTVEKAATAAAMSLSTARRYLDKPHFKKAYLQARGDVFAQAMARLQQHVPHAVVTLFRIMLESDSPAVKARAATVALRYSLQWSELASCEARISELEQDDLPSMGHQGTNSRSGLMQGRVA